MEPDPREPQDSPQPLYGVCGDTQEPCIEQSREAMCQPGESLGGPRAAAEGAPGGVSTCSQLSQLTRASHPNSLLGAATRLALCCYTQTSPLTVPIWEHHPAGAPPAWDPSACTTIVPQGFTSPTKAVGTTTLQHHHKHLVRREKGASLLPVAIRASFSILPGRGGPSSWS